MNNFLRLFTEANSRKASPDPFGGLTAMAERQEGTLALPHKSIERQTASLLLPLESDEVNTPCLLPPFLAPPLRMEGC